jgi:glutamyl-tRNA synthetase
LRQQEHCKEMATNKGDGAEVNNFMDGLFLLSNKRMTKEICRFAPSPTGFLHVGNARTALVNLLYAKQREGSFLLRIDDTDLQRCSLSSLQSILEDLCWMGISWSEAFCQASRMERYKDVTKSLIRKGVAYECYETPEELEAKREANLREGKPPIYDRSALSLTKAQIENYKKEGRRPYYRFLLQQNKSITWLDLIRGKMSFKARDLGDPIVIREDGTPTYILSSVVDDIDSKVTTILRGEDHTTNTAIQCQIFEALDCGTPNFGHLSLLRTSQNKISKRVGGFSLRDLRRDIHPAALRSFLAFIGSSRSVKLVLSIEELAQEFDINALSRSQTIYNEAHLYELNAKLIKSLNYSAAQSCIQEALSEPEDAANEPYNLQAAQKLLASNQRQKLASQVEGLSEEVWNRIKDNLEGLSEVNHWCKILTTQAPELEETLDLNYLKESAKLLPQELSKDSCLVWMKEVANKTGRKGADLYMPIRLALTGMKSGPQLHSLLSILGREEVLRRLNGQR